MSKDSTKVVLKMLFFFLIAMPIIMVFGRNGPIEWVLFFVLAVPIVVVAIPVFMLFKELRGGRGKLVEFGRSAPSVKEG